MNGYKQAIYDFEMSLMIGRNVMRIDHYVEDPENYEDARKILERILIRMVKRVGLSEYT